MRIAALLFLLVPVAVVAHANTLDAARMLGTWNLDDGARGRIAGPILISPTEISWTSEDGRRCAVHYRIVSRIEGSTFPGGPMESHKADDAYTNFQLLLEPQDCERNIGSFIISLTSEPADSAHFAAMSAGHAAQAYGPMRRASTQQTLASPPTFAPDEIAIYRDFLLHYPEQPSEMIGMQEYTTRFVEAYAFGEEPNPPKLNLETPTYSARRLPPEVLELTTEDAVTKRAEAQRKPIYPDLKSRLKVSEIAFDPTHDHAAFVYSSMRGKSGTSGTVVYEKQNGQWKRQGRILNFRIA